jgi:hypothetical protein
MAEGEPHQDHRARRADNAWLAGSLLLVAFGLLTAVSIGIPIAVLGSGLLVIKCRRRRAVCSLSAGVAVGLVVLVLSLLLEVDLGCDASREEAPAPGQTPRSLTPSCTLFGPKGWRAPTRLPALALGSIAGALAASGVWVVTRRQARSMSRADRARRT